MNSLRDSLLGFVNEGYTWDSRTTILYYLCAPVEEALSSVCRLPSNFWQMNRDVTATP